MGNYLSIAALAAALIASTAVLVRTYTQSTLEQPGEGGKPGKNAKRNKKRRDNLKAKLHASDSEKSSAPAISTKEPSKAKAIKPEPSSSEADEEFPALQRANVTAAVKPAVQQQRPYAERKAPKTRQGKVADMLDPDVVDTPTMARVVQINKQGQAVPQKEAQKVKPKPAKSSSMLEQSWVDVKAPSLAPDSSANEASTSEFEDDYLDRQQEEEEPWEQVATKASTSKSKGSNFSLNVGSASSQKEHLVPGLPSKKARQNAAKKAADKNAREAAEAERLANLQAHRSSRAAEAAKQSQRAKMAQGIKSVKAAPSPPPAASQQANGKALSGGMRYGMSESGNLIWE